MNCNCGRILYEEVNYCPSCGERQACMPSIDYSSVSAPKLPPRPREMGEALAKAAIDKWKASDDLEINLRRAKAGMVISALYNGFFSYVKENSPDDLPKAYRVVWLHEFDFQKATMKDIQRRFMSNCEKISIEEVYDDLGNPNEWEYLHESTEDIAAQLYDAKLACSCGCQSCEGTGWYRMGRSYKECCDPCPIHHGG